MYFQSKYFNWLSKNRSITKFLCSHVQGNWIWGGVNLRRPAKQTNAHSSVRCLQIFGFISQKVLILIILSEYVFTVSYMKDSRTVYIQMPQKYPASFLTKGGITKAKKSNKWRNIIMDMGCGVGGEISHVLRIDNEEFPKQVIF